MTDRPLIFSGPMGRAIAKAVMRRHKEEAA